MRVIYKKKFTRQYENLPVKIQKKFDERLLLFQKNLYHSQLHRHPLKGAMQPLESINITGDYRALFVQEEGRVVFYAIGTHSELY